MIRRVFKGDPCLTDGDDVVQFRLTYQGLLLAEATNGRLANARAKHKHEIRKAFHAQLKRLWEVNPFLNAADQHKPHTHQWRVDQFRFARLSYDHSIAGLSERFSINNYKFVPLITRDIQVHCDVDVLFLRNDPPGSVLRSGDIDNRLKTLFDALTMPRDAKQLGPYSEPDADEVPFFCLLEDDSLITRASVETDILLQPTASNPDNANDARVIVTIKTNVFYVRRDNLGFA